MHSTIEIILYLGYEVVQLFLHNSPLFSTSEKLVNRPSINNVTHFLRFLTPSSPLSPILLNRLMELHHLLEDPPPPSVGDIIYEWPQIN